jgi:hypothetical protein
MTIKEKLSNRLPQIDFLSIENFLSVFGHIIIGAVAYIVAFVILA